MKRDIVADALNQIMNIKRVGKTEVVIERYSKPLLGIFELMKKEGLIDYRLNEEEKQVIVDILKLNKCRAIKPRYYTKVEQIDKWMRRYLPSRNLGLIVISTNQGLLTHREAIDKNVGGTLMAYFY